MGQRGGLFGDGTSDARVGVTEGHHREPGDEVEVALVVRVVEHRALTAHERDGRIGVRAHQGAAIDGGCAHGNTIVPTPESVKSSSKSAWAPARRGCERALRRRGPHGHTPRPLGAFPPWPNRCARSRRPPRGWPCGPRWRGHRPPPAAPRRRSRRSASRPRVPRPTLRPRCRH